MKHNVNAVIVSANQIQLLEGLDQYQAACNNHSMRIKKKYYDSPAPNNPSPHPVVNNYSIA